MAISPSPRHNPAFPPIYRQRGVALLIALFALLLLSAIGLGMMYSASTESWINSNYGGTLRAYYAALAGLEEARDRLNVSRTTTSPVTPPAVTPSSAGGTIYIVNSYQDSQGNTVSPQPWLSTDPFFDDEYCHEFPATDPGPGIPCASSPFTGSSWYGYHSGGSSTYVGATWTSGAGVPSVSPNTGTQSALIFRWVRIQQKINYSTQPICVNGDCSNPGAQVCWNGANESVQSGGCTAANLQPVYLLTALAVAPNGARRMLQAEVAPNTLNVPIPAALTLATSPAAPLQAGQTTVCGGFSSAPCAGPAPALLINGSNPAACAGSAGAPAMGVSDTNSANYLCGSVAAANFPGSGTSCSGNPPSVANVGAANPNLASVTYLDGLVSYTASVADSVVSDCSNTTTPSVFGSPGHPKIVVVNGDCSMSAANFSIPGEGVLVVTGTYNFTDSPYNGVVLVIGQGNFSQSAASSSHFDGALLVAKTRDSARTLLGSLGQPTFTWTSATGGLPPGGAPSVQYDSCEVFRATLLNYKTLATRELMY